MFRNSVASARMGVGNHGTNSVRRKTFCHFVCGIDSQMFFKSGGGGMLRMAMDGRDTGTKIGLTRHHTSC